MTKSPSVGMYVRVSTQDQSTQLQENELRCFAETRGWKDIRLYADKATGTNGNRPQLKQLLGDARSRKLDIVLVWKLDRFARSLKDLVCMLQELGELEVAFVSLKDQLDLTTSVGRLMLHVIGAFGEFEASLIRERVKAGVANAKAKGTRLGRPPVIDVMKVKTLRDDGWSMGKIARQLGISKGGVHKSLVKSRFTKPFTKPEIIEVV